MSVCKMFVLNLMKKCWLASEKNAFCQCHLTLLCARHIYPSLVRVQPRKIRPCLIERLLVGRKESKQTNKQTNKQTKLLCLFEGNYATLEF